MYCLTTVLVFFALAVVFPKSWPAMETRGSDFTVHFFDVGQGDSSLLQCGSVQVLTDGGPSRAVLRKLGRAMPFTDRNIEYVFLSHPHSDHVFGLFEVLERYEVDYLFISEFTLESFYGRELVRLATRLGVGIRYVQAGDSVQVGDCGNMEVLWPTKQGQQVALAGIDYENDLSLVTSFNAAGDGGSIMFTGDINDTVEKELSNIAAPRKIDILKVPHHGSRHSSSPSFLRVISPEYAVFQVGENRYGQPSKTILLRYEKIGSRIFRNDRDGDIVLDLSGGDVEPHESGFDDLNFIDS